MTVRYITVTPLANFFKPATRAFGDVAVVGGAAAAATGPKKVAVPITNPDSVSYTAATTLTAAATAAATTVAVQSAAGFPTNLPFAVQIEQETLSVTAVAGLNWTVTRGANGTTAAAHAQGATVTFGFKGLPVDDPTLFQGDLGNAVREVFSQSPGPSLVWAVQTDTADGADAVKNALAVVGKLDVQIVVVANTPLSTANKTALQGLVDHVQTVSSTGGDGKERIGVVMLSKGAAPPAGADDLSLSAPRVVFVAHKSDGDAAAAVAGTIAGYTPSTSLLLKPVNLAMADTFTDDEILAFDTARIDWLTRPTLLPGGGLYMGEGYIRGDPKLSPYIDIIRTIDDVSFRLKAQLIQSIGVLRITRPGLRTLSAQMAAVLEPLKQGEVIDAYDIFMPLLVLLDKDPSTLLPVEAQEVKNARDSRTVEAIVAVTYAGAIHRLNITLKFQ
jgi:hypothetical protein